MTERAPISVHPLLILQEGQAARQQWIIDRSSVVLGRSEDCDVLLPERAVSRHHAQILRTEAGYILRDLGSKNGTWVNGRELTGDYLLQDGDEIQMALSVRLLFVGAEATVPLGRVSPPCSRGLEMDVAKRRVWVAGQELLPPLSSAQFTLLKLLYEAKGQVVSREEIVAAVWPEVAAEGVSDEAIDALVRRLRDRLAAADATHQYVATVRGHGFRFENREA